MSLVLPHVDMVSFEVSVAAPKQSSPLDEGAIVEYGYSGYATDLQHRKSTTCWTCFVFQLWQAFSWASKL